MNDDCGQEQLTNVRVLLLANSWVGWEVCKYLRSQDEGIVGLVLHPAHNQVLGDDIAEASGLPSNLVITSSRLHESESFEFLQSLNPDIIVSAWYGYILKPKVIQVPRLGCINLHGSYLPNNRGRRSNVWSIVEGTPAGATLHYIDEGIDTGDVIARKLVDVEATDTGETVFRKIEQALVGIFETSWPGIKAGTNSRLPQSSLGVGNYHFGNDVDQIDHIDLDRQYVARDLINILKARTFPPYPAAYFVQDGRKVFMRISLAYEEDIKGV